MAGGAGEFTVATCRNARGTMFKAVGVVTVSHLPNFFEALGYSAAQSVHNLHPKRGIFHATAEFFFPFLLTVFSHFIHIVLVLVRYFRKIFPRKKSRFGFMRSLDGLVDGFLEGQRNFLGSLIGA